MSFSDTANAKKYASIAEIAAAQAKLSADKLNNAPDYAEQAAASALAAASSAEVAVSAQSVVNELAISASESATSAAASAASAGDAAAAAISRSLRVPDGELIPEFPAASERNQTVSVFDASGNPDVRPVSDFATLDSTGKLPVSIIPSIALTEPFVVSSEAEMLALDAQPGDIAKRTDLGYSFCLAESPASTLSNWVQLTDDVLAQLGQSSGASAVGALSDTGSPSTVQTLLTQKANKTDLAGTGGSQLIGNGNDTVNNFLYHTPDEYLTAGDMNAAITSSLTASSTDGKPTWIKGTKTVSSLVTVPAGVSILNDGEITSSANTIGTKLSTETKIKGGKWYNTSVARAFDVNGVDNASIKDVTTEGVIVPLSDPSYSVELLSANNFTMLNTRHSDYTGAINLQSTNRAIIDGLYVERMWFHKRLDAGGYGVLLGGCNDTLVNNVHFVAGSEIDSDGYNGRHAIYQSTMSGNGSINTVVSNLIANYRAKTSEPAAGINIRSNRRMVINSVIIDGSYVSGNLENGFVYHNIISNSIIRARKFTNGISTYGISFGDTVSSNYNIGCVINGCVVSVQPESGIDTDLCYGISISGKNGLVANTVIDVPALSYPIIVKAGVDNYLINGVQEYTSTNSGGQAFIVFNGACSNITVSGCRTSRPWFRNVTNVTNLTVDFPRSLQIVVNVGVVTYTDTTWSLIASTSVSATALTINFNTHVTAEAVNNAIASMTNDVSPPCIPVITSRSGRTITVAFYTMGGTLINPSTQKGSLLITLNS